MTQRLRVNSAFHAWSCLQNATDVGFHRLIALIGQQTRFGCWGRNRTARSRRCLESHPPAFSGSERCWGYRHSANPCKSRDTIGDLLTSESWGRCQTPNWQKSWEQQSILSSQSVSHWEYRPQDRLQKLENPGQRKNLRCSGAFPTRASHKRLVVVVVTFEAKESRSVYPQVRSSLTDRGRRKWCHSLGKHRTRKLQRTLVSISTRLHCNALGEVFRRFVTAAELFHEFSSSRCQGTLPPRCR